MSYKLCKENLCLQSVIYETPALVISSGRLPVTDNKSALIVLLQSKFSKPFSVRQYVPPIPYPDIFTANQSELVNCCGANDYAGLSWRHKSQVALLPHRCARILTNIVLHFWSKIKAPLEASCDFKYQLLVYFSLRRRTPINPSRKVRVAHLPLNAYLCIATLHIVTLLPDFLQLVFK